MAILIETACHHSKVQSAPLKCKCLIYDSAYHITIRWGFEICWSDFISYLHVQSAFGSFFNGLHTIRKVPVDSLLRHRLAKKRSLPHWVDICWSVWQSSQSVGSSSLPCKHDHCECALHILMWQKGHSSCAYEQCMMMIALTYCTHCTQCKPKCSHCWWLTCTFSPNCICVTPLVGALTCTKLQSTQNTNNT